MRANVADFPVYYNLGYVNEEAVKVLRNRRVQCGYDIKELANFSRIAAERIRDIEALHSPVIAAELYALGKAVNFSIEVFFVTLVEGE